MAAAWISQRASQLFFLMIFLQVPLFRTGVCKTPLEVTIAQMAASEMVPPVGLKIFLYPGACLRQLYRGHSVAPLWNNILEEYNLTMGFAPALADYKYRLEVVAGSYFAVGGAIVSLVKPGRMSMFGILLITWGLIKDDLFGNPARDDSAVVHADLILFVALTLAVLSIRYDMNRVKKLARPIAKPLKSSTKSKLN